MSDYIACGIGFLLLAETYRWVVNHYVQQQAFKQEAKRLRREVR